MRRLAAPLLACLTLGLAPFLPEPHLVGKLRWVLGGGQGMSAIDAFDLALHGAPWIWLGAELTRLAVRGKRTGHSTVRYLFLLGAFLAAAVCVLWNLAPG